MHITILISTTGHMTIVSFYSFLLLILMGITDTQHIQEDFIHPQHHTGICHLLVIVS